MKRDESAQLVERRVLSSDACLLVLESEWLAGAFLPGQFTMVRVAGEGMLLRRPYSFCDAEPDRRRFSLLIKEAGQGTRRFARLPLGERVDCLGPLGSTFSLPRPGHKALIVAGGVGIAPFVSLSRSLARRGQSAVVLLGGRSEPDLYLREAFEEFGMQVSCATEDGSFGRRGRVTALLEERLEEAISWEVYSCGPSGMLDRVARAARERDLPHQVSIERRMGCGMGCCLGCVVHTKASGDQPGEYQRGCTEGPVFDADALDWERDPYPL